MKKAKFITIFILLLILITLLVVALWCVLLPGDVKDTIGSLRWRRDMEIPPSLPQAPAWMEQMIEANYNKSHHRTSENVLLNALGQLQISGPENIMTYITQDSPCKTLKPHIKTFERIHKDLPDSQLFVRLFKAIEKFYFAYCGRDERYRKLFSPHDAELIALHEQFVDCEGSPDWYENPNSTTRCAEANEVVKCNVETLQTEIGERAAKAYQCIFEVVLDAVMIHPCNFTTVTMSELSFKSAAEIPSGSKALILFFTFVVIFMLWKNANKDFILTQLMTS